MILNPSTSRYAWRVPHPVWSLSQADANRARICEARGYCGPFLNTDYYDAYPDPLWHGMGECLFCCSTVLVAAEELKRRLRGEAIAGVQVPRRPPEREGPAGGEGQEGSDSGRRALTASSRSSASNGLARKESEPLGSESRAARGSA